MTKMAGSGSISQRHGSAPRAQIRIRIHTKMSWIRNTGFTWSVSSSRGDDVWFGMELLRYKAKAHILGLPGPAQHIHNLTLSPEMRVYHCIWQP
jgi:hypothetical protein